MSQPSKSALNGPVITIRRGLAIYQVNASPYWYARIRFPGAGKNIVRSTKETSRIEARRAAEELYVSLLQSGKHLPPPRETTFGYFSEQLVDLEKQRGKRGEISPRLWANTSFYLRHKQWGIVRRFDKIAVDKIGTVEYNGYMSWVRSVAPELKPATMNHIASTFSKVLKLARDRGAIDIVPALPRVKRKDNPRPFFRFYPLVSKETDEYKKLLLTAQNMAAEGVRVRETIVTDELYDLILFLTHSFLRPIESEFYGLKHKDVSISQDPRSLLLTIRDGKTGFRNSNTMEAAVTVYQRIKDRYPNQSGPDDYLFFPMYKNRATAKRNIQRQFHEAVKRAELTVDPVFDQAHSLYSLRHTAICMRLVLSKGEVNIYTLAKNAGTSVNQIERFYARYLPLSKDLIVNLQTFN